MAGGKPETPDTLKNFESIKSDGPGKQCGGIFTHCSVFATSN
jgi:hypothetical protein